MSSGQNEWFHSVLPRCVFQSLLLWDSDASYIVICFVLLVDIYFIDFSFLGKEDILILTSFFFFPPKAFLNYEYHK